MRSFHMTFVLCAVLGYAVCTQPSMAAVAPQPASWAGDSDLSGPVQPDSVFRESDQLYFTIAQGPNRVPPMSYRSQVQASCMSHTAWVAFSEGKRRVYPGSSDGRYRPPIRYAPVQTEALYRNPAVLAACHDTPQPQWRVLDQGADGQWLLIDAISLINQGDIRRVWAAWDEPAESRQLPYEALRAQAREHLEMNCNRGTVRVLSQAILDRDNRVTDGQLFPSPMALPVSSDGPYQPLYTALCEQPMTLASLKPFEPRTKLPARAPVPYLDAEVVAQLQSAPFGNAPRTLDELQQTSTFISKTGRQEWHEHINLFPMKGTDLTVEQRDDIDHGFTAVTYHGLINVALRGQQLGTSTWIHTYTTQQASFTGDWQKLAPGSDLQYRAKGAGAMSNYPALDNAALALTCHVGGEVPASQINQALSGNAKAVKCVLAMQGENTDIDAYYLEDYGYFFQQHKKTATFELTTTLQSVHSRR